MDQSKMMEIIIQAKDNASAVLSKVQDNIDGSSKKFGGMNEALANTRAAFGAVGIAAAGYLTAAVKSASKAAESTEQLKIKLQDQGISWDKAKGQVDEFTKGVKSMSTFTGGQAKEALDNLITRHVSMKNALRDQTAIVELATAKHMTLKEASDLVADAENGRMKGLVKLGVVTAEEVKHGISMEDINKRLNASYKGLAEGHMNSLPGQLEIINRNFGDFKTSIGNALLPLITKIATEMRKFTDILNNISPGTKQIIEKVLLATAVLGPLIGGISVVQKVLGTLGPVVKGVTALIGGLSWPILLVVGVIAAFTLAYTKNFGGFKTFVDDVVKKAIVIFNNLVTWVKTNWPMIKQKIEEVIHGIVVAYNQYLKPVVDFMIEVFKQLVGWVIENWPLISKTIKTVLNGIWDVIKGVLGLIQAFWNTWGKTIMDYVGICFNNIKIIIMTVIKVIQDIIKAVMQAINGDWSGAWHSLIQAVKDIFGGIGALITNIINGIGKIFGDLVQVAVKWGSNMIDGFIKGITGGIQKVKDAASGVIKGVKNFLGFNSPAKEGEGQHIVEWGSNMVGGFMDGIKNKLPAMQDLMKTAIKAPVLTSNVNMDVTKSMLSKAVGGSNQSVNIMPQKSKLSTNKNGSVTINFNGNYSFKDKNDIDYFMNQSALLIKRRQS